MTLIPILRSRPEIEPARESPWVQFWKRCRRWRPWPWSRFDRMEGIIEEYSRMAWHYEKRCREYHARQWRHRDFRDKVLAEITRPPEKWHPSNPACYMPRRKDRETLSELMSCGFNVLFTFNAVQAILMLRFIQGATGHCPRIAIRMSERIFGAFNDKKPGFAETIVNAPREKQVT